eukprot:scaffold195069_cov27-Tisochrysis_lutea.AAC.1
MKKRQPGELAHASAQCASSAKWPSRSLAEAHSTPCESSLKRTASGSAELTMVVASGRAPARATRWPQSVQSAPSPHSAYAEPAPPSSHSPSLVWEHESSQRMIWPGGTAVVPSPGGTLSGGGGAAGDRSGRWPQSAQSEPSSHNAYAEPSPPSSHSPSELWRQPSEQAATSSGSDL